ncbi:hypothetical protein Pla52o_39230 [Novipirellula galeiformis]|uniref:Bacteriophage T5 Orf172 DNA-binding domain-containing protein n=1 Tax=Novipirellula galeiformis TaxID=2528004 RepID=A0A5C6CEL1_9BACT|nr:GIY-YIG nuclease family protein [Novipirellula galeiformis]TWU21736.1 hypothetical protein Pla52o_39230 [Novipirellula galeiformis]
MMDFEKELADILANDPLGLLVHRPKVSLAITADERLVASFEEINTFIDAKGSVPTKGRDIGERKLASRLEGLRADPDKAASLLQYDRHDLLADVVLNSENARSSIEINSVEDILADDVLGLLDPNNVEAIAADIFTLKNVSKQAAKQDHVAKRKPCNEFDQFEPLFKQANSDLKSGVKKTVPFKSERQIRPETIFILQGMMVYVAGRGKWEKKGFGNFNARLYCVFDNGTESNMLLRSLAAAFWKDENSRQIVAHDQPDLLDEKLKVNSEDEPTGYVYVLRSLSEDPNIQEIDNLFKIGFSTQPVKTRIQNAAQEPTYLMADVQVAMECEVYNANPQKLEKLLHRFFGNACLNLDVFGITSKRYTPREWFVIPLHTIEAAIEMLVNGEIVKYRYDAESEEIVPR